VLSCGRRYPRGCSADATSVIEFHIETFGAEALEIEEPVLDVFITEAGVLHHGI